RFSLSCFMQERIDALDRVEGGGVTFIFGDLGEDRRGQRKVIAFEGREFAAQIRGRGKAGVGAEFAEFESLLSTPRGVGFGQSDAEDTASCGMFGMEKTLV